MATWRSTHNGDKVARVGDCRAAIGRVVALTNPGEFWARTGPVSGKWWAVAGIGSSGPSLQVPGGRVFTSQRAAKRAAIAACRARIKDD